MLLKYKPMIKFLREHNMETYIELTNIYSEMDTVYYGHLRTYYGDTAKLIQKVSKGNELLFSDKVAVNSKDEVNNASMNQSMELSDNLNTTMRKSNQLIIDDRCGILNKLDNTPIVVAIAQSKHLHFDFEEVFRSQNKLIVDAVCKEFVFVLEFFDLKMVQVSTIFNQIFSRVINKYLDWLV